MQDWNCRNLHTQVLTIYNTHNQASFLLNRIEKQWQWLRERIWGRLPNYSNAKMVLRNVRSWVHCKTGLIIFKSMQEKPPKTWVLWWKLSRLGTWKITTWAGVASNRQNSQKTKILPSQKLHEVNRWIEEAPRWINANKN